MNGKSVSHCRPSPVDSAFNGSTTVGGGSSVGDGASYASHSGIPVVGKTKRWSEKVYLLLNRGFRTMHGKPLRRAGLRSLVGPTI